MTTTSSIAGAPKRLGLSARILIGLVAGVVLGLVIGERAAALQFVADGYVKLLQMTVLPYVVVSIIAGLGSLSAGQAKTLGVRVGTVIALLWVVARNVSELQRVLLLLSSRGGAQRVMTLLRLEELKPRSPLPLAAA